MQMKSQVDYIPPTETEPKNPEKTYVDKWGEHADAEKTEVTFKIFIYS